MLAVSLEGFAPRRLHATRSPLSCHPERSEGSAFLPCFSFSLRNHHSLLLPPTSVNSVPSALRSLSCLRSGAPSGRHFSFNFPLLTPFLATLAGHSQLSENATTLSLVFVTLTDVVKRKSFACHSYRKHRGVAVRPLPVSPHPPLVYPACPEK